jgi:hypothetical protein
MKKLAIAILTIFSLFGFQQVNAADGDLFEYPKPPEELTKLDERCNFLVEHFWERCDFKSALSRRDKLDNCFSDWISFIRFANTTSVFPAVDKLLETVKKSSDQSLAIAQLAEKYIYSDEAEYVSDELYLPFAKFAAENKKIPNEERVHFQAQVRIITSSAKGAVVPDLQMVNLTGDKVSLRQSIKSTNVVLFFNDPDCFDCTMARVRLAADYNLKKLIEENSVQLISIYPGEPDDEWRKDAADYPDSWTVVAVPDADLYFNLSSTPKLYCLNSNCKVTLKDVPLDNLLQGFQTLNLRNEAK